MNTQNEIWKPIPGYEGQYEVSDQGRVRSLDRTLTTKLGIKKHRKGQMLGYTLNSMGYPRVWIGDKKKLLHALVLEAFVGPRPPNHVTRHLDGNPLNPRLDNLAWGTQSENLLDKQRHGTDTQRNKTHCPRGHQLVEPNITLWAAKRGQRNCRACARARSHTWQAGIPSHGEEFNKIADQKYAALMAK